MNFRDVLLNHGARYPAWQPQDVYKLCHQAAMGSEHAVLDRERARAWLQQELDSLADPRPDLSGEPLIDPISAGGSIARVHLRPLVRLGLSPVVLLEAFLRTAAEYRGSTEVLEQNLDQAAALLNNDKLPISAHQFTGFFMEMTRKGFPAVHHSEVYTRTYLPAYRVVLLSALPEDWKKCSSNE